MTIRKVSNDMFEKLESKESEEVHVWSKTKAQIEQEITQAKATLSNLEADLVELKKL